MSFGQNPQATPPRSIPPQDSIAAATARLHDQADRLAHLIGKLDEICDGVQPEAAVPSQPMRAEIPAKQERPPFLTGTIMHLEQRNDGLLADLETRLQRLSNNLGC